MIREIRSRFSLLTARERARWATLLPIGVITSLLETAAAAAVYGLVAVLSGAGDAVGRAFGGTFAGLLASAGATAVGFATVAAALHLLKNGFLLLAAAYRARLAGATAATLSSRTLSAYLTAPYVFHLRRNSADLSQSLLAGVPALLSLCDSLATLITELLVVTGLLLLVGRVAPVETLIATLVIIGPLIPFVRMSRGAYARLGARNYELEVRVLRGLQQAFGGIKEVQVFGREPFFYDAIARDQEARARIAMRQAALENVPRLLTETAFVLGMLVLVIVMRDRAAPGGTFLPFVGLYAYAGLRIIPAAHRVVYHVGNIRYCVAATSALSDGMAALEATTSDRGGATGTARASLRDAIRFEHVSYAYEGRDTVLRDISLTVRRGECIGIVGATGAGKSTLVDIMLGLLEPSAGRVSVDGVAIGDDRRGWQRQVGYVPQAPFLLDDTLARNVAFGVPHDEVDEVKVRSAVAAAQLGELVSRLPLGLDTPVGEKGTALSGGERQRLSIARALYNDPDVLIFDEATSALDPGTEHALVESLDALKGTRTMVIIAHRMSTVERCDRIVALRDGRVADEGSPVV